MKICDGGSALKKRLYRDLKPGDTFIFGNQTTQLDPEDIEARYRTCEGHINFKTNHQYEKNTFLNDSVILFPHACLTLGDPE